MQRARTWRPLSSWPRAWTIAAWLRTPTSRRRSSPSGAGTGPSRGPTPSRRRRSTRSSNDERNVGRLMLNLGGLHLLLGEPQQAIDHLEASFALAVEAESKPDAAQALGGLATVHLQLADYDAADENARKALALLEGREDFPGRGRPVASRARAGTARAGSPRRGGEEFPGCGRRVRADGVRGAQGRGMGRARRPRESSGRRRRGGASLSECCRGAPGHPVLRKEERQCTEAECSSCWPTSH